VPLVADFPDRLKASSSSVAFAVRENFSGMSNIDHRIGSGVRNVVVAKRSYLEGSR
jgi:hypothetical protein